MREEEKSSRIYGMAHRRTEERKRWKKKQEKNNVNFYSIYRTHNSDEKHQVNKE